LENLVNKFNKRRYKRGFISKEKKKEEEKKEEEKEEAKNSKRKVSELNMDDLEDLCAEDDHSPPVESVIQTRVKDNKDIDLHQAIPYQNYFYNSELRAAIKNDDSTESTSKRKRQEKELNKELLDHNTGIKLAKRKNFSLEDKQMARKGGILNFFKTNKENSMKN